MKNPVKKADAVGLEKVLEKDAELLDTNYNASLSLRVPLRCGGLRLDQILVELNPQYSRSRWQSSIREGQIAVNGLTISEPKRKLVGGEELCIAAEFTQRSSSALPQAMELNILFEDESILILDKPAGLVVHPGNGHPDGTLLNALLYHHPALESLPRVGIVHRLDKDTTGLMVVAKTLAAQTHLVRQLQARTVKRYYHALVRGLLDYGGTVDAPIGRHPTQRTKMAVSSKGRPSRTHYRVVERFLDCTLVDCALETGRTHQIRVHLTHIGHPLVGDPIYGRGTSRIPRGPTFDRQALHARRLELVHPESQKTMAWKSPIPADLASLIEIASLAAEKAASEKAAREQADDDWLDPFDVRFDDEEMEVIEIMDDDDVE